MSHPPAPPPPTTRQRSIPLTNKNSTKELANAEGINTDVWSKEQAVAFLQAKEYLVPGKQTDLLTLAHILFQFRTTTGRAPRVMTDGIRAVAFLIADAAAQQMAEEITVLVKAQLQDQLGDFNTSVETMRDAVEHVEGAAVDITDKMDEFRDSFHEISDRLAETTHELNQATQELTSKIPESQTHNAVPGTVPQCITNPMSYAAITQQHIPMSVAAVVTRGETTDKQILIQKDPDAADNNLGTLTELVAKANTALDLMGIEASDCPAGASFVAAKKQRNGNVLYLLNTKEAAQWFKQPGVQHAFMGKFGSTSTIRDKLYHVVAEFVPTTFDAGSSFAHARIEADSELCTNTIAHSKYIKPVHLRTSTQKSAHVIFGFNNRDSANKAIEYGMYVEGKEVKVWKLLSEPRRCLKCQHYGHYATDCKAPTDVCGRCNGEHRMAQCTVTETDELQCANCTGNEALRHGAGDRNCPTLAKEKEKLQERIPENKYKYFPSNSPRTWCLLNQPANLVTDQQQAWQQGADWVATANTNIDGQQKQSNFMNDWQTVRRRRGNQARTPFHPQADSGWPTRPTQTMLDGFMQPTQGSNPRSDVQQDPSNIPWGD
jgi:hypothetical protein